MHTMFTLSVNVCVRYGNKLGSCGTFRTKRQEKSHRHGCRWLMWIGTERKVQKATCVMYHNIKWVLTYLSEKGEIWKIILEFAHSNKTVIYKTGVNTVRCTYCRPLCCLQCFVFLFKEGNYSVQDDLLVSLAQKR